MFASAEDPFLVSTSSVKKSQKVGEMEYRVACLLIVFILGFIHYAQVGTGTFGIETKKLDVFHETPNYYYFLDARFANQGVPLLRGHSETTDSLDTESIDRNKIAEECKVDEVKQVDCNTCKCINGIFACTRKLCLHKRSASECQHGETKRLDCNTCTCLNGVFGCTKKLCISKRGAIAARFNGLVTRQRRAEDSFSCSPGQTFSKECNTCTCTPDGKNAICTLKFCGSPLA
ncbi:hypothetical protein NQ318_003209 [Aromia moschata]|uniref:Pacifastin domain-containing protein n=1 Tax=Aromia moschata TaxID=1265417 RepID=A0AAV8XKN8_9CUCU|nr:hypothetical protein NQ318_003209 [Aromia moschata]